MICIDPCDSLLWSVCILRMGTVYICALGLYISMGLISLNRLEKYKVVYRTHYILDCASFESTRSVGSGGSDSQPQRPVGSSFTCCRYRPSHREHNARSVEAHWGSLSLLVFIGYVFSKTRRNCLYCS